MSRIDAENIRKLRDEFESLQKNYYVINKSWKMLLDENRKLRIALIGLKKGSCWCKMGIGDPMCSTHSNECINTQELLKGF